MTRRISLAILLTVWAMLIVGCVVAYVTVRWALVETLDHSIIMRASAVPELRPEPLSPSGTRERARANQPPETDRYIIKTDSGQTISPPTGGNAPADLQVLSRSFSNAGGVRRRALTFRAELRDAEGRLVPLTIVYQTPATHLDRLLSRLAMTFILFGGAAGIVAAVVAWRVSRTALKPLHETAAVIGTIEPRHLDRRIELTKLPAELIPMATHLNLMLERIERAYAQRQAFLANASHELRTPVAAMVTTAEVSLRLPREVEHYQRTIQTCLSDARLLRDLVERLMEQCRADALSHDEAPQRIDIAPLLNQSADQAQALGRDKCITVKRAIPAQLVLTTQPSRLRSVVQNLVSNAVSYNREGGVVELIAQPNQQFLHIIVKDTGPGIAPEHLPHLFEPFYRVDKARSHEAGHMGLGLSLVESHVFALGGKIQVQSVVGEGTTFRVDLPIDVNAPTAH